MPKTPPFSVRPPFHSSSVVFFSFSFSSLFFFLSLFYFSFFPFFISTATNPNTREISSIIGFQSKMLNQRLKQQQHQALMQQALLQQQSLYHPGLLAAPQVRFRRGGICSFSEWNDDLSVMLLRLYLRLLWNRSWRCGYLCFFFFFFLILYFCYVMKFVIAVSFFSMLRCWLDFWLGNTGCVVC